MPLSPMSRSPPVTGSLPDPKPTTDTFSFLPVTVLKWKDDWKVYGVRLQNVDPANDGMLLRTLSRTNIESIKIGMQLVLLYAMVILLSQLLTIEAVWL